MLGSVMPNKYISDLCTMFLQIKKIGLLKESDLFEGLFP